MAAATFSSAPAIAATIDAEINGCEAVDSDARSTLMSSHLPPLQYLNSPIVTAEVTASPAKLNQGQDAPDTAKQAHVSDRKLAKRAVPGFSCSGEVWYWRSARGGGVGGACEGQTARAH